MKIKKIFTSLSYLFGVCLAAFILGIIFQPSPSKATIPCTDDKCINELCVGGFDGTYCDIDAQTQECASLNCDKN